jgi:hypothetical protein
MLLRRLTLPRVSSVRKGRGRFSCNESIPSNLSGTRSAIARGCKGLKRNQEPECKKGIDLVGSLIVSLAYHPLADRPLFPFQVPIPESSLCESDSVLGNNPFCAHFLPYPSIPKPLQALLTLTEFHASKQSFIPVFNFPWDH